MLIVKLDFISVQHNLSDIKGMIRDPLKMHQHIQKCHPAFGLTFHIRQPEDVLSYALFPAVAKEFFEYRDAQDSGIDKTKVKDGAYPV